ncbi:hypothetical protein [Thermomonospora umbrina]|uniref:hypothetical protein n=1 Tax=Thermomonospora umbrina TaxID=111806 RepID=UPI000E236F5C|nr:hypothetical protein [Thermomonospora umbrina]
MINLARQIFDWEKGLHFPRDWAAAYAVVFDTTEMRLFGDLPDSATRDVESAGTVNVKTRPEDGDDAVRRRTLLELLTAMSAGLVVPAATMDAVFADVENAVGGPGPDLDVAEWEHTAWEYAQSLWVWPVGSMVHRLASDLMSLGAALKTGPERERKDLLRVSAQLSVFLATEFEDLGRPTEAGRAYRVALRAAEDVGDRHLADWVRGGMAARAVCERRPRHVVDALARDVMANAGGVPGVGQLKVLSAHARSCALHGDGAGAERSLRALSTALEKAPAEVTTDKVSAWGWPEANLRFHEGLVYGVLGDPKRATDAVEHSLSLAAREKAGGRLNSELVRALALVQDREVTEGLDHAVSLAGTLPSSSLRRLIVGEILKALPDDRARALPAARELAALPTSS